MSQLPDPSKLEAILALTEGIPTIPSVADHLAPMAANPKTSLHEISEIIACDPVVTAHVLRVANSQRQSIPVYDLPNAVIRLGPGETRRAAGAVKSTPAFNAVLREHDCLRKIWLHSLITAFISHGIAESGEFEFTEAAYACGLLHDFGRLFLATNYPEPYAELCEACISGGKEIIAAERRIFGMTHMAVSKSLFTHWKMPSKLTVVATHHHDPSVLEGEDKVIALCVAASNTLAHYALEDEPHDYMALAEDWLTEMSEHSRTPEAMQTGNIRAILETAVMRAHLFEGVLPEE